MLQGQENIEIEDGEFWIPCVKEKIKYKGYDVYSPDWQGEGDIGFPIFYLVNGNKAI